MGEAWYVFILAGAIANATACRIKGPSGGGVSSSAMGSMTSSSSEVGLKERLCFYVEVLELDEYYEKVLLTLTGDDSRLLLSATQAINKGQRRSEAKTNEESSLRFRRPNRGWVSFIAAMQKVKNWTGSWGSCASK
jgi:hypothetical protein